MRKKEKKAELIMYALDVDLEKKILPSSNMAQISGKATKNTQKSLKHHIIYWKKVFRKLFPFISKISGP